MRLVLYVYALYGALTFMISQDPMLAGIGRFGVVYLCVGFVWSSLPWRSSLRRWLAWPKKAIMVGAMLGLVAVAMREPERGPPEWPGWPSDVIGWVELGIDVLPLVGGLAFLIARWVYLRRAEKRRVEAERSASA